MNDTEYSDVKETTLEELNFKTELIPLAAKLGVKNASKIGKKKTIKAIEKILKSGSSSFPDTKAGETAKGTGEPIGAGDKEPPGSAATPAALLCYLEVNEDEDMIHIIDERYLGKERLVNSIAMNGVRGRGRSRLIAVAKESAEGLGYRVQKVVYK
jgi:hypothetical protein